MWWGVAITIPIVVPASMSGTTVKGEVSLYSSCIFPVLRAHFSTMFLYYVRFKVNQRVEDDKFACKAVGLRTRKMGIIEVFFLDQQSGS